MSNDHRPVVVNRQAFILLGYGGLLLLVATIPDTGDAGALVAIAPNIQNLLHIPAYGLLALRKGFWGPKRESWTPNLPARMPIFTPSEGRQAPKGNACKNHGCSAPCYTVSNKQDTMVVQCEVVK